VAGAELKKQLRAAVVSWDQKSRRHARLGFRERDEGVCVFAAVSFLGTSLSLTSHLSLHTTSFSCPFFSLSLSLSISFSFHHKDATEFVLTGGSAGGLSTFLHADRVAARLKKEAPKCAKIRAAPVVGFFLDHDNFAHTDGYGPGSTGGPNTPQWSSTAGTGANYTMWMKYVYGMQNMTFDADGGLTKACQAKHPTEPHLCFMSPHMADVIETPLFMFNSQYDAWQLGNEFQAKFGAGMLPQQNGVIQYGKDFITQLNAAGIGATSGSPHGGMITSCICHGCPWSAFVLDGKTSDQWYADWFYGATKGGAESLHIDTRTPNGGGAMGNHSDPRWRSCTAFPDPAAQPNPPSCRATEYCCPDAKHCLTPTMKSCVKDATACTGGEVCCPLTKICVAVGAVCAPTPQCKATEYCCPDAKHCLTPTAPGVFCDTTHKCASSTDVCCPLTKLCVSVGAACNPPTMLSSKPSWV
tara:strand:+ start:1871 stop:3277 length:1407 start_codon:yes stop_codon:yes gene_type:complete